jgi:hypothetical protein
MSIGEIITIISLIIAYSGALIGIYVNLRVKLKELDVKMIEFEKDLINFKRDTFMSIEKMDIKNSTDHNSISDKLDKLFDKIIELKLDSNDRIKVVNEKMNHINGNNGKE